jgi:hypothetical protein
MRNALLLLVLLSPALAQAQLLTSTPQGVIVAHDGKVQLAGKWNVDGVAYPTFIASSGDRVIVLDAIENEVCLVDAATGKATLRETDETPVDAAFLESEVAILARDARVVQVGERRIRVGPDPAFLRAHEGKLYVYSRAAGTIEEIDGGAVTRMVTVGPFASDFEISGDVGYLTYPRDAKIRTVLVSEMEVGPEMSLGGVPVDLTFAGGGTAITARVLAVADPSSKRVWMMETTQSLPKAVARGFVRGLLGIGLFGRRSSAFPTGVDRVLIDGSRWVAYDSSTGTLHRFSKRSSSVVATKVPPGGYTLTERGVAWWDGTSVAQTTLE